MNNSASITSGKKLYDESSIQLGTFLGGPLVAGYLLAHNFKLVGQVKKASYCWISAVVVYIGSLLILEIFNFSVYFLPVAYLLLTSYVLIYYQGAGIKRHIENGGIKHPMSRAIIIGLSSLVIHTIFYLLVEYRSGNF